MQTQFQHQNIYLDTCCLGRPFDAQSQGRIYHETEAIQAIVRNFLTGQLRWVSSSAVETEVSRNPNVTQRNQIQSRLSSAHQTVQVGVAEIARAVHLEKFGFPLFDALHIACAESGGADVLLTTDDVFLNRAKRLRQHLYVAVENPHTWWQAVIGART